MTYDYLEETRTERADVNGTALVSLGPIGNQWWAPTYVRVSTRTTAGAEFDAIPSDCTVFKGPPNVFDASTYLDDTVIGNNDMSSIIAGQIVQSGQVITGVWSRLVPNTIVILTIYGRRSDLPSSMGEVIPEAPGVRFSGGSTITPHTRSLVSPIQQSNIDVDTFVGSFYVGDAPHLGVRFESVTNHFRVRFDYGQIPGPGNAGYAKQDVSVRQGSTFEQSIPVSGAYVDVTVFPSAANSAYILGLWTTPEPFIRTSFENGYGIAFNITGENVNAGITETHQGTWVSPGEAHWSAVTGAAVNAIVIESIDRNGTVRHLDRSNNLTAVAARPLFLPATDIQVRIFNGDGAARTFDVSVVRRPIQPGL